jgi:hypothetical protein
MVSWRQGLGVQKYCGPQATLVFASNLQKCQFCRKSSENGSFHKKNVHFSPIFMIISYTEFSVMYAH